MSTPFWIITRSVSHKGCPYDNGTELSCAKVIYCFYGMHPRISEQILGKQRLSDLYLATELQPDLELIVHTYNFRMTPKEVVNYMNEEQFLHGLRRIGKELSFGVRYF